MSLISNVIRAFGTLVLGRRHEAGDVGHRSGELTHAEHAVVRAFLDRLHGDERATENFIRPVVSESMRYARTRDVGLLRHLADSVVTTAEFNADPAHEKITAARDAAGRPRPVDEVLASLQ